MKAKYSGVVYKGVLNGGLSLFPHNIVKPNKKKNILLPDVTMSKGSISGLSIGNTSGAKNKHIKWYKYLIDDDEDGVDDREFLICSSCLAIKVSYGQILSAGYNNKEIKVDGVEYKCRILSSSEWDNFVLNKLVKGPAKLNPTDIDKKFKADRFSIHNKAWNWFYIRTICENGVVRGLSNAKFSNTIPPSNAHNVNGWRPLLERKL
jgi:hypothetical protein